MLIFFLNLIIQVASVQSTDEFSDINTYRQIIFNKIYSLSGPSTFICRTTCMKGRMQAKSIDDLYNYSDSYTICLGSARAQR